jgi:hypothetical protein
MRALMLSVPLSGPTGRAGVDAAEAVRLAVEDAGSALEPVVLDAGPGICGPDVPAHGATTLRAAGRLCVEDARFVPA